MALPVSACDVTLRRPAGEEEVLLREATRLDMDLTVRLLSRLASFRCEELTVSDVERLLIELRRMLFGDLVRGVAHCASAECGAPVDVTFRLTDYLSHHAPGAVRYAEPSEESGWYALRNTAVTFRLPLASDQIAVARKTDAERALIARCVRPAQLPARLLTRIARLMQMLAPSLADVVEGTCPECSAAIAVYFDPQDFILREMRDGAAFVFEEIHLLASRYHWSEERILSLPASRRVQYAEMIRHDKGAA